MTIQARIVFCLICCALAFGAGWKVHAWKVGAELASERQAILDDRVAQEKVLAALTAKADKTLSNDRLNADNANQRAQDYVTKNPSAIVCKLGADRVRLLQQ